MNLIFSCCFFFLFCFLHAAPFFLPFSLFIFLFFSRYILQLYFLFFFFLSYVLFCYLSLYVYHISFCFPHFFLFVFVFHVTLISASLLHLFFFFLYFYFLPICYPRSWQFTSFNPLCLDLFLTYWLYHTNPFLSSLCMSSCPPLPPPCLLLIGRACPVTKFKWHDEISNIETQHCPLTVCYTIGCHTYSRPLHQSTKGQWLLDFRYSG